MRMENIERRLEELDLARDFSDDTVGRALREEALVLLHAARDDNREAVIQMAREAAGYARIVFMRCAFVRDATMDEWFSLPILGVEAVAAKMETERASWRDAVEDADEDIEAERRQDREESGFYGRSLPYEPKDDRWIFIRFGSMPSEGRSRFGLAREDNEDGVDDWRRELGGMTHEAGVSVFKAYRHPSFRDHYVLIEPHFTMARYGVSEPLEHLFAVMGDRDEPKSAVKVDGLLKTIRALDGTTRIELGSDGEYLIDAFRPYTTQNIGLDQLWMGDRTRIIDLLHRPKPTIAAKGYLTL